MRGAHDGLEPRPAKVRHRFVPHLAPQRVMGQTLDVLGEALGMQALHGVDDAGMQVTATLVQQAAVGDLLGERVLERVFGIGEQTALVQEFGGGETPQHARNVRLAEIGHRAEQLERHVFAHDGSGLQETLLVRRQPVDASGQDRLDRGGHRDGLERLGQAIGPALAGERARLDERADGLLEEQRVALRPCGQHVLEGLERRIVAEHPPKELVAAPAGAPAAGVPHAFQNCASAGNPAPHAAQTTPSRAPQPRQKFDRGGLMRRHRRQVIARRSTVAARSCPCPSARPRAGGPGPPR